MKIRLGKMQGRRYIDDIFDQLEKEFGDVEIEYEGVTLDEDVSSQESLEKGDKTSAEGEEFPVPTLREEEIVREVVSPTAMPIQSEGNAEDSEEAAHIQQFILYRYM